MRGFGKDLISRICSRNGVLDELIWSRNGVLDELLVGALHQTAVHRDVLRVEVTGVVRGGHVLRGSVGRVVLLRVEQMVGIKMIVLCFESPL